MSEGERKEKKDRKEDRVENSTPLLNSDRKNKGLLK